MASFFDTKSLAKVTEIAKTPAAQACIGGLILLSLTGRWNRWMSRRRTNNYDTDKTWDWKKEIVVITGASSGIGAKVVSKLERDNVKVIILDLNKPPGRTGPNTSFYQIDLTSPDEIVSTAQKIRSEHGEPTVLINNAGMGLPMPSVEMPEPKLRKMFEVNILAPMLLVQQFLPSMVKRNHGHIVNISSMAAFCTQAINVPYACTKVALLAYHEGLIQELRHLYKAPLVRATVVHPTWVRTAMTQDLFNTGKLNDTTVDPDHLAGLIVDQIYSGYGAQLVVPPNLGWVSVVRGLPTWLQENIRDGVTTTVLKGMGIM